MPQPQETKTFCGGLGRDKIYASFLRVLNWQPRGPKCCGIQQLLCNVYFMAIDNETLKF